MTPTEFWHIYNCEINKSNAAPRFGALSQDDADSLLESLDRWEAERNGR